MKKVIKLLVAVAMFVSFSNVPIYASPTATNYYDYRKFLKTDEEGHEIVDAEFTQVTIDGKVMLESIKSEVESSQPTGEYNFISSALDMETAYSYLTPDQKAFFEGLQTLDDYNRVKAVMSYDAKESAYCAGKDFYVNHLRDSKGISVTEEYEGDGPIGLKNNKIVRFISKSSRRPITLYFNALSFTFIEEIKTPQGFEKTNIIVPMKVTLAYTVNADDTLSLSSGYAEQESNLLMYNPEIDYSDVADVYAKVDNTHVFPLAQECNASEGYWHNYSCNAPTVYNNINSVGRAGTVCKSVVVDKTSSEDLNKKVTIESFVNGKKEVNVQKSEEVTIQVKVYNGSKTPLYTNKVVSKLPKDFTLVEGSVLKNGTYDDSTRTVTWNYDYLDSMDSEIFSYKVKAPDTVNNGTTVKTSATLTSYGDTVPLVSDEATVGLGDEPITNNDNVVNPKTGSITEQLVVVILTISIVATLFVARRTRIKTM